MKKYLAIAAAAVVFIAAPALAADLAVKAASPMMSPITAANWSGLYLGLNGGGGFTTANVDDKDCYNCDSTHTSGFLGVIGGQVGYNWQMRSFVYGIEADADWASYNRKFVLCNSCGGAALQSFANNATKLDAIISIRGRAGLVVDNALFYVTGGAAFADMKNNFQGALEPGTLLPRESFVDNSWHAGFVAGAGVETKWDNSPWSFRAEWLHYQFQTKFVNSTGGTRNLQCCQFGFGAQTDVFRLGVNYNLMPTVVARY